mmetsp:Transcript_34291/g.74402  ORF Transcript_34291/g.74402 Transcript_34291/m.74402 type:complete len:236 (-) Transcript_34291:33-740(-)
MWMGLHEFCHGHCLTNVLVVIIVVCHGCTGTTAGSQCCMTGFSFGLGFLSIFPDRCVLIIDMLLPYGRSIFGFRFLMTSRDTILLCDAFHGERITANALRRRHWHIKDIIVVINAYPPPFYQRRRLRRRRGFHGIGRRFLSRRDSIGRRYRSIPQSGWTRIPRGRIVIAAIAPPVHQSTKRLPQQTEARSRRRLACFSLSRCRRRRSRSRSRSRPRTRCRLIGVSHPFDFDQSDF